MAFATGLSLICLAFAWWTVFYVMWEDRDVIEKWYEKVILGVLIFILLFFVLAMVIVTIVGWISYFH